MASGKRLRNPITTSRILLYITIIFVISYFFIPFLWMVITSLKSNAQVFTSPPVLIPKPIKFENYIEVFKKTMFGRYLLNTIILSIIIIIGTLFSNSLIAYGFSRIEWVGREAVFFILLLTLLLPTQVTLIPLFVTYKKLGIIGAGLKGYLPLILPYYFGNAYNTFLLRQFFINIPTELSEAAKIDGCSEFKIFYKIIIPLSKPALITVSLLTLINVWNSFLEPLVYLQDEKLYTVSLGLAQLQGKFVTQWNQVMAASTVTVIPILLVFLFAQKYFVEGVSITGIK